MLPQQDWERVHVYLKEYNNPYAFPVVCLLLESAEFNGNLPYLKVITGHKTDAMLSRYITIKAEHVALAMHKKEIPPELAPAGYLGKLDPHAKPAFINPSWPRMSSRAIWEGGSIMRILDDIRSLQLQPLMHVQFARALKLNLQAELEWNGFKVVVSHTGIKAMRGQVLKEVITLHSVFVPVKHRRKRWFTFYIEFLKILTEDAVLVTTAADKLSILRAWRATAESFTVKRKLRNAALASGVATPFQLELHEAIEKSGKQNRGLAREAAIDNCTLHCWLNGTPPNDKTSVPAIHHLENSFSLNGATSRN